MPASSNYGTNDVQTFQVTTDLSGAMGQFVIMTAADNVVALAGDASKVVIGVIVGVERAAAGDVSVMTSPGRKVPCKAAGAIVVGAVVGVDAAGKADAGTATDESVGVALDALSDASADQFFTLLFGYRGII